eukprot:703453-Amphidinium_carterae.1
MEQRQRQRERQTKQGHSVSWGTIGIAGNERDGTKGGAQHGTSKGKGNDKGKGKSEKRKCWKCGKVGHYSKDCCSGLRALGEEGGSAPDTTGAASSSHQAVCGLFLAALTLGAIGPQHETEVTISMSLRISIFRNAFQPDDESGGLGLDDAVALFRSALLPSQQ